MAVRIRLRRIGAKKQPFYRVVVADSRSPRDGRFLDAIGTYNPRSAPVGIDIDRGKALRWLEKGAVPTDSARSLLSKVGIWQEFKTGVRPEPRPTPATPAERTAAEPVVDEESAAVATEVGAVEAGEPEAAEAAGEPEEAAEPEAAVEAGEPEAAEAAGEAEEAAEPETAEEAAEPETAKAAGEPETVAEPGEAEEEEET